MFAHRCRLVVLGVVLAVVALAGRLFYVQLAEGKTLARAAAAARERPVEGEPWRGVIMDRNGMMLAGAWPQWWLVASTKASRKEIEGIERELGLPNSALWKKIKAGRSEGRAAVVLARSLSADDCQRLSRCQVAGKVQLVLGIKRYNDAYPCAHIIGHTTRQPLALEHQAWLSPAASDRTRGASGIELRFDQWLSSGSASAQVIVDGHGNLISGLGWVVKDTDSMPGVVLTIDRRIQMLVEEAVKRHRIDRGAVVVMDVATRDILAIASVPGYPQDDVASQKDQGLDPLFNRALALYYPGSIFKLVVAAAALEEGSVDPNEEFTCSGSYTFPRGVTISCWKEGGHGKVTISDALAVSCNSAFIQIGLRVGRQGVEKEASLLRVTDNHIIGYPDAGPAGMVHIDGGPPALGNACLGQQGVALSPVMVANLLATVASGGWWGPPRLVLETRRGNQVEKTFSPGAQVRVVGVRTAAQLQTALRRVVVEGTGRRAQGQIPVAGKTASSQRGEGKLDTWFAGYAPAEAPRVAVAIVAEGGASGGSTCAPVFKDIVDGISKVEGW